MDLLEPHRIEGNLDMWVDERIWGHRFHNEQTPWLVLLEFFAVFQARYLENCALSEKRKNGKHEDVRYSIPKQESLRFLIFNNPNLRHIEKKVQGNDERWKQWQDSVHSKHNSQEFDYLKTRFGNFSNFAQIVELFQNTSLEQERNRRWTSKFIFPYGPDCIYADVREERGTLGGSDRRFYARGGELLYLMFNRSRVAKELDLASLIKERLLRQDDLWNCLGRNLISDGDSGRTQDIWLGYLPYESRKEYEDISEDWLKLLSMKIPGAAVLDPLMRLTALHLLLYIMRRSSEEISGNREPYIVLEIAAPQKTALFNLSVENYKANRTLSRRALETHLISIKNTSDWREACAQKAPEEATLKLLWERFRWKPKEYPGGSPDQIFDKLLEAAHKRHKQHLALVLTDWSRRIGLSVARRHTGTWYSPDDALLKALVMATVDDREEYNRFLKKLYDRYRLVIGVAEAEKAFGCLPTDERVLAENTSRLEQRLRTLGLLRRLSDDCAYVINTFGNSQ